jgi:hypothetical protein
MPFFRMLKKEIFGDTELDEDGISSLVSLTQQVFIELERELKLAGFGESIPAPQQAQGRHSKDAASARVFQAARTGAEPRTHH